VEGFWNDQRAAQAVMRQLAQRNKTVSQWRGLQKKLADIDELLGMAGDDDAMQGELQKELDEAGTQLDEMEFLLSFSGPYDDRNALVAIHAGAGGTESQDWAEMLMRMYLRWAERRGFTAEVLDASPGDEAGIKSVTIAIGGEYAYGYLKSEHGVHRLIRLSPFDADHARHTSFALVEVMPEAEGDVDVDISPEDIKVETFRSSGPGGQNMQKTSSAVRITHIPSGIVVSCQSERSQHLNKDFAMKILRSRLIEKELERQEEEKARLKGKRVEAGWGNQIRSYVLHPYRMVKDHRTDHETGNTDAVLDGDLDGFIDAYLRATMGSED
jgi:peptide chain release factor 2